MVSFVISKHLVQAWTIIAKLINLNFVINIYWSNIIIIMSDDEGFSTDIKSEMVQVNFIPLFPPKKYNPKVFINQLKLQPEKLSLQESIFIDRNLQGQLADKFINTHKEKIVFSENGKAPVKGPSCISFQSAFQGGNLEYVLEEKNKYHLYIRPDSNTNAHHQWFYFRVKNKAIKHVTLVIHNFTKPNMLYLKGLKPYFKSLKENYTFYEQIPNNVKYEEEENEQGFIKYCLAFQFSFKFTFDDVQFCSQPAYTCHKLNSLLISLPFKKIEISRSVLGQKVQAIIVNEEKNTKAIVVVIARQHPGQAVGSWMMQGFLKRLQQLQSSIMWIIIPMVNVDGVKLGNNRTGILGHDFNRNWNVDEQSLRYHLFPELMGIIKYFKRCKKEKSKRIKMFIDLHGHSSQPNAFAYGPPLFQGSQYYQNSKLFPFMLSKANSHFNLRQCSYDIDTNKKNCARSVFFHRLGFPYSYTIQSSFGIYNGKNINESDMLKMGEDICTTAFQFVNLLVFRRNGQRLKEMISDVRKSGLDVYNTLQNQSDSDQDDNKPQRIQFQKKMATLLIDPSLQQQEIKRLQQQKTSNHNRQLKVPHLNINVDFSHRKERIKVERVSTEGIKRYRVKSERQGNGRRSSLFLPSINGLQIMDGIPKKPIDPKKISKNMSLHEITQRLMTMKHNKIGRRILILNDYPTSLV